MRRTVVAHDLLTVRSVVVSGQKLQVPVDERPTCQHCGRRVGEYFGLPWRVRCPERECRKTASSD